MCSSDLVGLNGGSTYGIGVYSSNRNSAVFDTVESTGTDPLELNYYQGGPVKIGSGANGSKALYAVGIYDNGNQVVHAGNVATYALPISGGTVTGNLSINGSATFNSAINQGVYTRRQIALAGPGTSNFGNWKQFIRLWAATGSGANLFTLKVSVRGTWNWTPVFGTVEAYYSLYLPADSTISTTRDFRITHVSGPATDNIRLGDAVIENGFVSIPVWGANTNGLEATIEQWHGSQILGTVTTAVSETMPAFIAPNFRGGLTSDGNAVLHAGNYSSYALPLAGGTMTGAVNFIGTSYNNVGGSKLFAGNGGYNYLYTNTNGMVFRDRKSTRLNSSH